MNEQKSRFHGRKWLALFLALLIIVGTVPTMVFARNVDDSTGTNQAPANTVYQVVDAGGPNDNDTDKVYVSKVLTGTDTENVFDITLTVQTETLLETLYQDPDMAVAIVMDISGSMLCLPATDAGETPTLGKDNTQYDDAIAAAKYFINKYCTDSNGLNVVRDLALVTFNTHGEVQQGLTDCTTNTASSFDTAFANINADVSYPATQAEKDSATATTGNSYRKESHLRFTNIEAGLKLAENVLSQSAAKNKFVLLLTDGFPTTYLMDHDTSATSGTAQGYDPYMQAGNLNGITSVPEDMIGQDGYFYDHLTGGACVLGTSYSDKGASYAAAAASNIDAAGMTLYTVGINIGGQVISDMVRKASWYNSVVDCYFGEDYTAPTNLTFDGTKCTNDPSSYEVGKNAGDYESWLKNAISSDSTYYSTGNDYDSLRAAYDNFLAKITELSEQSALANWVAADPMGTATPSEVDFLKFYTKAGELADSLSGSNAQDAENTASVADDPTTGVETISWDLKNSGYTLHPDSTDTRTIYLYSLKYQVRLANELDDFVPGDRYDTNGTTTLSYQTKNGKVLSDTKSLEFPIPAVKGYLGEFAFTKVDSETGEAIPGVEFTLTHSSSCAVCAEISGSKASIAPQVQTSDENGIVSFSEIPSGHWYSLTETSTPDGYAESTASQAVEVAYGVTKVNGLETVTKEQILEVVNYVPAEPQPNPDPAGSAAPSEPEAAPALPANAFTEITNVPLGWLTVTKVVAGSKTEADFDAGAFSFVVEDAAGEIVAEFSLPTQTGEWSYTVPQLQAGEYTVRETAYDRVGRGWSCSVSDNGVVAATVTDAQETSVTVTNTYSYSQSSQDATFTKSWDDDSNRDGLRPDSVRFELFVGGVSTGKTKDVGPNLLDCEAGEDGNTYSVTFTYDSNQYPVGAVATVQEIGYTADGVYTPFDAELTNVPGYTQSVSDDQLTVTNTHEPEVVEFSVQKVWAESAKGMERTVTIHLYADGEEVNSASILPPAEDGSETPSANPDWTVKFTADKAGNPLYVYQNGQKITYSITEDRLGANWTQHIEEVEGGWVVRNSWASVSTGLTSLSVQKVWDDNDDAEGKRPASVKIRLLRDNTPTNTVVELNEDNGWYYKWESLSLFNSWTVAEEEVPEGYTVSYKPTGDGYIVTNTLPETETPPTSIEEEVIEEEDVPLADIPKTGDNLNMWLAAAAVSGVALLIAKLFSHKREDEVNG